MEFRRLFAIGFIFLTIFSLAACDQTPKTLEPEYSVNFDSNGGSQASSITLSEGETLSLPTSEREGYTFDGWYSDESLTTAYTFTTMPAEDITLYAKWIQDAASTVTITFNSNGGSLVEDITLEYETIVTEPTEPSKEGYTFDGWYSDESLTTAYTFTTMPEEDITLYAKWIQDAASTVTITFNSNGGSLVEDITQDNQTVVTEPVEPSREGYTFDGWYSDESLTTAYTFTTMPEEDFTLYAKWTINQYTITYNIFDNYNPPINDILLEAGEVIINISLGYYHSSAITSEGRVFTWGDNLYGQLGDGTTTERHTPTDITSQFGLNIGETVIWISLGADHSSAITSEGRVFTWGYNDSGQLGDGTTTERHTPTDITSQFGLAMEETITSISLGYYHSTAITSEGRVFTWGADYNGQLGDGTTTDGTVVSLIPTDITSQFELAMGETITSISSGYYHSLAITSEGRVFTWGYNWYGQLGDGTTTERHTPTDITSRFGLEIGETVTSMSLGDSHSSVITSEGRVFTWGDNWYGQLGDDTTTGRYEPTEITSQFGLDIGETVTKISLGANHSSAITSAGRVFTWGDNWAGQLGDGTTAKKNLPTEIISQFELEVEETVISIPLGSSHSSVITSEGRVFTWGDNSYGRLGDGTITNRSNPQSILNTTLYLTEILAYDYDSIVEFHSPNREGYELDGWYTNKELTEEYLFTTMPEEDITLYAKWIQDDASTVTITFNSNGGSLVDDVTLEYETIVTEPTEPSKEGYTFDGWYSDESLTTAYTFTTMPEEDFTLYAKWTINQYTITYNTFDNYNPPINDILLEAGETVISISLGGLHSSALTSEGRVFTWGHNTSGQLGDGTTTNRNIPIEITNQFGLEIGETVTSISLGSSHSSALTSGGRVFTWGANWSGQLGDDTITNRNNPTDITSQFGLSAGETVTSISLGNSHSSALTSEGRVFTWGGNAYGQLGDGTIIDRHTPTEITSQFGLEIGETVTSISLGSSYSSALTSEGRVFTWGYNWYGQLGDGTTTNRNIPIDITNQFGLEIGETVTSISLGSSHSSVITSEGRVFTWGANYYGQLGDATTTDFSVANSIPIDITSQFDLVGETVTSVSLGYDYSSAITSEGRVFTWGHNYQGQLGDGTTTDKSNPTETTSQFELEAEETVTRITLGTYHSSAITSEGRVFTWGLNSSGQLGDGTTTKQSNPQSILGTALFSTETLTYDYNAIVEFYSPDREGYDIDGWYSDKSLSTTYTFTTMPTEDLTLYAKWDIVTYNITYNLDGGSNGSNPDNYTVETSTITLEDPVKDGYTFNGWFDNPDFTGVAITEITIGTTEDIVLYAKWIIN